MNTLALSSRRAACAVLALWATLACAQPIYRIVGPDGKVTFSDRPPAGQEKATPLGPGGRSPADGAGGELSFELRQLVGKYPVTLYTGDDCEPCTSGRSLLLARGVPFSERTVRTPADIEALQRSTGSSDLPLLTIGSQRIKGYAATEWNQYLDAAGYPSSSRLPAGYRHPPATPLTPPAPETPARSATPPQPSQPALPPPPPAPHPSGIVF